MIPKKPKPPCKDCLDREVGCHSRCEHYAEFRKRKEEIYEYRKEEADAKHDIMTHIVEVRKKMNMTERKPKGFIRHRNG